MMAAHKAGTGLAGALARDRRPEDPAPVELVGARVFVVPSRSGGRLHLVVVHDGRADCKWHGVRCWAAREAMKATERDPDG
jgi:hypothetical protein